MELTVKAHARAPKKKLDDDDESEEEDWLTSYAGSMVTAAAPQPTSPSKDPKDSAGKPKTKAKPKPSGMPKVKKPILPVAITRQRQMKEKNASSLILHEVKQFVESVAKDVSLKGILPSKVIAFSKKIKLRLVEGLLPVYNYVGVADDSDQLHDDCMEIFATLRKFSIVIEDLVGVITPYCAKKEDAEYCASVLSTAIRSFKDSQGPSPVIVLAPCISKEVVARAIQYDVARGLDAARLQENSSAADAFYFFSRVQSLLLRQGRLNNDAIASQAEDLGVRMLTSIVNDLALVQREFALSAVRQVVLYKLAEGTCSAQAPLEFYDTKEFAVTFMFCEHLVDVDFDKEGSDAVHDLRSVQRKNFKRSF